jgi:Domain of unknown function (DUF4397)
MSSISETEFLWMTCRNDSTFIPRVPTLQTTMFFSKGSTVRITKLIAASALVAAAAGFGGPRAAAQEEAKIRVGHFSPDAPPVDIYLDNRKTFAQVRFPLMSAYTPVAAGKHVIDIRAAGSAATDPALISVNAELKAGKPYLVAALGPAAALQGALIDDDLTPPAKGKSKVRVIHAAVGGDNVDVVVAGSTTLFKDVAFGKAAPYSEVEATKYDLSVRKTGTTDQIVGKVVTLQSGGVYTIVAIGDAAGTIGLRGFADLAPSGTPVSATDPTGADDSGAGTASTTTVAGSASTGTETTTTAAASTADSTPATDVVSTTETPTTEASTETTAAGSSGTPTETTVPETTSSTTAEVAVTTAAPSQTDPVPTGAVDSGFGGMSDSQSAAAVGVLGAMAASFVVLGARRRRATR